MRLIKVFQVSKQICIHIGTHKTATTSIQNLLCRAAPQMAQRGVYVPKAGRISPCLAGHHNIGWSLRRDPRASLARGTIAHLVAELRGCRQARAVISSEDFEYFVACPELIADLESALRRAGWEPSYLVFLRDPADYAISLYHELERHGLAMPFADFIDQVRAEGHFRFRGDWTHYLDYGAFLARWRAGATAPLHVRSYDDARRGPGVLETFLTDIALPADDTLLGAQPAAPGWFKQLRHRLKGRPLPSCPTDSVRLNTNRSIVSEEMRAEAARIAPVFHLPQEARAATRTPVFH